MYTICSIGTSDWIDITNIIVTSVLGIWIGSTVQKNLTNNRALKEFYIDEIKRINEDYSSFMKCLFNGDKGSKFIQEWFKVMHIKIETIQSSIHNELRLLPEVLKIHIDLKQYITSTQEFNANYQSSNLIISVQTKSDVLEFHRQLKHAFVQVIIGVNRANFK